MIYRSKIIRGKIFFNLLQLFLKFCSNSTILCRKSTIVIMSTKKAASFEAASVTIYIDYASLTLTAFNPFSLFSTSKTTLSFSRIILVFNPEECTKMSCPPSAGEINPKPFVSLKNFTVPCCIVLVLKIVLLSVMIQHYLFIFFAYETAEYSVAFIISILSFDIFSEKLLTSLEITDE